MLHLTLFELCGSSNQQLNRGYLINSSVGEKAIIHGRPLGNYGSSLLNGVVLMLCAALDLSVSLTNYSMHPVFPL